MCARLDGRDSPALAEALPELRRDDEVCADVSGTLDASSVRSVLLCSVCSKLGGVVVLWHSAARRCRKRALRDRNNTLQFEHETSLPVGTRGALDVDRR